jgi:hypothetical protein
VRAVRTLAILALAMVGTAGVPTCDSCCVARAADGRPQQPDVIPAQNGTSQPRPMRERVDYIYPPPLNEQREPLRGDFWDPQDVDRTFPDFDRIQGFERILPPPR